VIKNHIFCLLKIKLKPLMYHWFWKSRRLFFCVGKTYNGAFWGIFERVETFLTSGQFRGQKGFSPLKKSQEMLHYLFCPRQKRISWTFKFTGTLVFLCPSERKRLRGRGWEREREGEREREREVKGKEKGKRERENKSAGDYISKPLGPEWKIHEICIEKSSICSM
jgi:hypothetical protein